MCCWLRWRSCLHGSQLIGPYDVSEVHAPMRGFVVVELAVDSWPERMWSDTFLIQLGIEVTFASLVLFFSIAKETKHTQSFFKLFVLALVPVVFWYVCLYSCVVAGLLWIL